MAFPSIVSARWHTDTAAVLRQLIRHLQAADYGDRLFGCMITGLMSEEWCHGSIHTDQLSDYSWRAQRASANGSAPSEETLRGALPPDWPFLVIRY